MAAGGQRQPEGRASAGTRSPTLPPLPRRERAILQMRFADGLTQTEIAKQMGISQMHVSRLISRSLATLRRAYREHESVEDALAEERSV